MTLDYDLVIIGGTSTAHYAALIASQSRARVALIEPEQHQSYFDYDIFHQVIQNSLSFLDKVKADNNNQDYQQTWQEIKLYVDVAIAQKKHHSLQKILSTPGVDIIFGSGHFQDAPDLSLSVNHRNIKGRKYLIASGSIPTFSDIHISPDIPQVTTSNIWHYLRDSQLPKDWVILGGTLDSIEISQVLSRLGCQVTLIVKYGQILPAIDAEISRILQAQLEAEGIRLLTNTEVTQVRIIDQKKWLQAGDKAIETDEIVIATSRQANIDTLNLPSVGVKWHQNRLLVNDKLQTTNPHIYACGDVIGGYNLQNIANYEAKIAVENALFFPIKKVNYHPIPWSLSTQPMVGQIGLIEFQAKRQYSEKNIIILKQYFKNTLSAHINDNIIGLCKLILHRNGEILGAAIIGNQTRELINIIALCMSKGIKIQKLQDYASITGMEILDNLVQEWQQRKLNSNLILEEYLDDFFLWRRNWRI
ncbi:dihydrolipoyl dehydrogenase family protein [Calothrix sp. 336/3]|uniref:dihydrolipoyl dehydrogenase family protein n=1 Tax=Calothrix sp. 336/3 TaxID=1337936 RepID=UPI0004E2E36B|nr:NAD(P)/FAD-dependent oxidoreductase [Calothrix sp. 336/3]AKG24800.1 hypothetical protein IJ00_22810 [Calothrix sp. 336/3]